MSPEGMPPQRQGMSTGTKILIALGVLFALLLVLCCGGIALMTFYFRNAVSTDPVVVQQVSNEIASMDLPPGFRPMASVNVKNPASGQALMQMAVHQDPATDSDVMLIGVDAAAGPGAQPDQMRQQMEMQLEQSRGGKGQGKRRLVDTKVEQRQIVVEGKETTFSFTTGNDGESKKPRLEVAGSFQGKSGTAMLVFDGDAEKYPPEAVVKMIESIKTQ